MVTKTTKWVDASAGTATISNMVGSAGTGSNRRVIAIQCGNMVRFVGYDIA
jgi:hypothetical protein